MCCEVCGYVIDEESPMWSNKQGNPLADLRGKMCRLMDMFRRVGIKVLEDIGARATSSEVSGSVE
jgi:hypothetical protein